MKKIYLLFRFLSKQLVIIILTVSFLVSAGFFFGYAIWQYQTFKQPKELGRNLFNVYYTGQDSPKIENFINDLEMLYDDKTYGSFMSERNSNINQIVMVNFGDTSYLPYNVDNGKTIALSSEENLKNDTITINDLEIPLIEVGYSLKEATRINQNDDTKLIMVLPRKRTYTNWLSGSDIGDINDLLLSTTTRDNKESVIKKFKASVPKNMFVLKSVPEKRSAEEEAKFEFLPIIFLSFMTTILLMSYLYIDYFLFFIRSKSLELISGAVKRDIYIQIVLLMLVILALSISIYKFIFNSMEGIEYGIYFQISYVLISLVVYFISVNKIRIESIK